MKSTATSTWRETTLADLVEFHDHKRIPLSSTERASRKGEYPYYGASGVIDHVDAYIFDGPYLLISEDGENLNSRKTPIAFRASGKFWVNNHAHIVRGKPKIVADRFLEYLIAVKDISGLVTGAAQPKLSQANLKIMKLCVPDFDTQTAILNILSAYDDLIENNTRRIKILEEMAQMLYREWFVNFRFPGHEKVQMVDSELGPIPEGWTPGTISQMAILHREGINPADFPDELFLHFSIPSFDNSRTPVREMGAEIKSNKYRVVPGCVLLSKLNPRIPRLWMPSLGVGLREITSTEFLVLTPPVTLHRTYLFQFLSSEEFSSSLTGLSLGTSTSHQRVKPDDFLNLPSLLPARSVVDEFCRHVDPMMDGISVLRSKNHNLRTTRDLLLPKLISGEIPVEAAAELMEQTA